MAKRPATNDAGNASPHKKRKTDTPERRGLPAIRAALRAAAEEEGTPLSHALDVALPSAAFFDVERHLRPLVQSVPLVLYHRSTISEILVRGIASPAVAEVIRCVEMRSALMVRLVVPFMDTLPDQQLLLADDMIPAVGQAIVGLLRSAAHRRIEVATLQVGLDALTLVCADLATALAAHPSAWTDWLDDADAELTSADSTADSHKRLLGHVLTPVIRAADELDDGLSTVFGVVPETWKASLAIEAIQVSPRVLRADWDSPSTVVCILAHPASSLRYRRMPVPPRQLPHFNKSSVTAGDQTISTLWSSSSLLRSIARSPAISMARSCWSRSLSATTWFDCPLARDNARPAPPAKSSKPL